MGHVPWSSPRCSPAWGGLTWACSYPPDVTPWGEPQQQEAPLPRPISSPTQCVHPPGPSVASLSYHNHNPLTSPQTPSHTTCPISPPPPTQPHHLHGIWFPSPGAGAFWMVSAFWKESLPRALTFTSQFAPHPQTVLSSFSPLLALDWWRKLSFHAKWTSYKIILTLPLSFHNLIPFPQKHAFHYPGTLSTLAFHPQILNTSPTANFLKLLHLPPSGGQSLRALSSFLLCSKHAFLVSGD